MPPGVCGLACYSGEPDTHFSILEGFDTGYYFTTTLDMWPYAQPAFEARVHFGAA